MIITDKTWLYKWLKICYNNIELIMVRRNLDDIKIVEPPLHELTKKHSHKRACFFSCLFLVFLIVSGILGLRLYLGAGPQTIKEVPPNFPPDIPLYDKNNIEQITFIPGQYKDRGLQIATFVPRVILAPFIARLDGNATGTAGNAENQSYWNGLRQVVAKPPRDYHDTVQIEWSDIDADYNFIVAYYKKELLKKNFVIESESSAENTKQFSFKRDSESGSIYARGVPAGSGTEYLILTVNLP